MRDDQLRQLLGSADRPVEPEHVFSEALFERLTAEADGGRRPRSRVLVLLAATLLLAATIGLGAAVAGGLVHLPWVAVLSPSPSAEADVATATPASSPPISPSGSPAPTAGRQLVQAPAGVLPYQSIISLAGISVQIHTAADPSSAVAGTVGPGSHLLVGLPLVVDGVLWYDVTGVDDTSLRGWAVLDPTDGTVTVEPVDCPVQEADATGVTPLGEIHGVHGWPDLACHGDVEITVQGVEITSGIGGVAPGTWSPAWLAYPFGGLVVVPEGDPATTVAIRLPPSVSLPPNPSPTPGVARVFTVTGHFDDAASAGCSITDQPIGDSFSGGPRASVDPAHAVVYCEEMFVATSIEVTGTTRDPLAP